MIAIVGPWIAPHPGDVVASHLTQRLKPPSAAFPFGTDNLGRDLLSRVILGIRGALEVALIVVALAAAVGVPLGLVAGYASGWPSELIMRITDVFLSLPQLVLALALAQLLTPSLESAMIALAMTCWPFFTRLVFAETRRLKASLFVDALRGIGADSGRILFAHILPNAISPVIVQATIGLGLNPVFKVGTQLLEIMRWHAPDSGVGRGRDKRHRDHIIALLRRVQLADPEAALERYPHQFSGGQRQRLVISAALATAPALVIADEPTTALDVTTQQQILDLLRELAVEFGLSMLFVTHDLGVVAQLYAGQLVESGNTAELLARPRHPYTKALLACHPDRAVAFSGIPGTVPSPLHAGSGCRFAPRCSDARHLCVTRRPHLMVDRSGRRVDCALYDMPEKVAT
jgi:oligopeptide/dipeptide ABC transporter ATP-binding protein